MMGRMAGQDLASEANRLEERIRGAEVPADLEEKLLERLSRLAGHPELPSFVVEMDQLTTYVDWVVSLPWKRRGEDVLDLEHARQVLDSNHYGLEEIKTRILEYMAVMRLKRQTKELPIGGEGEVGIQKFFRAPMLFFVGLVGTGKTTIAYSIAEAMGRKFVRIPFGGMGSPLDLRGRSRQHEEAEPGYVIKALRQAGTKNPVMLLDEIDRVTDEGRSSIMGVLVELLDPEQNTAFMDHYMDYPFDLSEVLFVATANNTRGVATAVLDRLEPVQMPSYTDEQKTTIGKRYMLPKIVKEAGLAEGALVIEEEVWPLIVRPLGFDAGMRTLGRTINGIVRKVARLIVEGKGSSFKITPENVKEFLPRD